MSVVYRVTTPSNSNSDYRLVVIVSIAWTLMVHHTTSTLSQDAVVEYCQLETFSPRCRQGHVIIMRSARFGRMRVGKCIDGSSFSESLKENEDTLGCSADVLNYADGMCSGKQSCDIAIPNRDLLATRPCLAQLTMYFEASYDCVEVAEGDRSCSVIVSAESPMHLLGPTDSNGQYQVAARCGSRTNSWIAEAHTGQNIEISLVDFDQNIQRPSGQVDDALRNPVAVADIGMNKCPAQYGYIIDKAASAPSRKNTTVCTSRDRQLGRTRFVYRSTGNYVEIVLESTVLNQTNVRTIHGRGNQQRSFLLALTAVGCSNLVPPVDAWLRRTDNEATVGCYTTRQRWHLHCQEGQWKGTIGHCTGEIDISSASATEEGAASETSVTQGFDFQEGIAIVAVTVAGVVVCLIIIFVGISCTRRYHHIQEQTPYFDINKSLTSYGGHA